ncbi:MAG TPA: hypothetical protein DEA08_10155 [Planctomycetes bacterium]|nr:hypothetical protein [Planctomycetota bacterium]
MNAPDDPNQKQPEFQLHRSRPQDVQGGGMGPLPIVIVVLLLGVGGFFLMNSSSSGKDGDATPTPTAEVDTRPDVEVPSAIWDRLEFLVNEGRTEEAIDYGKEQDKTFPNKELRKRVAALEQELAGPGPRSVLELMRDARKAFLAKNWSEVIDLTSAVLNEKEDGEAYYMRGVARGMTGEALSAQNDLESARENGHPEAQVQAAIDRFQ